MNQTNQLNHSDKSINEKTNEIQPIWLKRRVPRGYWENDENVRCSLIWLFEVKLQWSHEDIKQNLQKTHFTENKLGGMLMSAFKSSPHRAVSFYSNGEIKPWELKMTPLNYFDEPKHQIEAIKWLFEKKLNVKKPIEFKGKLSSELFSEHGLGSLLHRCNNYFDLVKLAYPDTFNEWEVMELVPAGFWEDKTNRLRALRWLFYQKLEWNNEQIMSLTNAETFRENKLSGLFQLAYKGSPYEAVKELLNDKVKPWQFSKVSNKYWKNEKNRLLALRWLVEEKCKDKVITKEDFAEHGLLALLQVEYNNRVEDALNSLNTSVVDTTQ